jgi:hypothetical protein
LRYQGNFAAGKNKIINGDFNVWQRGTSFSTVNTYTADRWRSNFDGTGATRTVSQQTFTPGTAPVAGYEGQFFFRFNKSVGGSGGTVDYLIQQPIEDVRTLAGQTVTLSFWAKANANLSVVSVIQQYFGSGGSSAVDVGYGSHSLTTSWQRFTATYSLGSLSGKTIGTSSYLMPFLYYVNTNSTFTIDIWGIQLEAGSVATAFQTATGTLQGELAAAQRYYWRTTSDSTTATLLGNAGIASSTTAVSCAWQNPVPMRVEATSVDFSNLAVLDPAASRVNVTGASLLGDSNPNFSVVNLTGASGLTASRSYQIYNQSGASGFVGFSAEL